MTVLAGFARRDAAGRAVRYGDGSAEMWMETERRAATWEQASTPGDFAVHSVGDHFAPWVGMLAEYMLTAVLDEVSESDRPIITVYYNTGEREPRMAVGVIAKVQPGEDEGQGDLVFVDGVRIHLPDVVSFGL